MSKKLCLLSIFLCISLCACQGTVQNNQTIAKEEDTEFIDAYMDFSEKENAKRVSLIYFDDDSIPELLVLKSGEYRLYSFHDFKVKAIDLPNTEIKAKAYVPRHDFEDAEYPTFYWFEYVPYKGLMRVHGGNDYERFDYYLKYKNDSLKIELKTKSVDYSWYTYDGEKEISNEDFLGQFQDLGYDELVPCSYLYEDVMTAYENIDRVSDTQKILEDFVSGETDALCYVEEISDIPEEGFVTKSFADLYEEITSGEEWWGSEEYVDFDNDGEEELILHGYAGACLFFDVIGDTVYTLLKTGSTTDVASVAQINGKRVIELTDLTHTGRKDYRIMRYDSCGCLFDWFQLHAEYEGDNYSQEGLFRYRNKEISKGEFETILNGIGQSH